MSTAHRLVAALLRVPALLLLGAVRCYQLLISPLLGPTCRYYPSCSSYAVIALGRHGALWGSWLTVRRLLRCHPWTPGGVDDVPQHGWRERAPRPHDHHPRPGGSHPATPVV